jgi:hypothetical protein
LQIGLAGYQSLLQRKRWFHLTKNTAAIGERVVAMGQLHSLETTFVSHVISHEGRETPVFARPFLIDGKQFLHTF